MKYSRMTVPNIKNGNFVSRGAKEEAVGLSLLLVLFLAPRGFSPGTLVFPSPQKPTFPNSNSARN